MLIWGNWRAVFLLVAMAMVMGLGTPAVAQSAWTVDAVRGTLVRLDADRWVEVSVDEAVPLGVPLRTLAGSTARLRGSAATLTLGSGTLVRFLRYRTASVLLEQYSGSVDIQPTGRGLVELRTPTVEIATEGGALTVEIAGGITSYKVETGSIRVIDVATGDATVLVAGTSDASSSTGKPAVAPASAASPSGAAAGNGNSSGAGQGNGSSGAGQANGGGNGGNGQGNGSGAGNGQGNGSNGNGNGNGNGKK